MNYWVKTPSAGAEEILGAMSDDVRDYSNAERIALAHALSALSMDFSLKDVRIQLGDLITEVEELRGEVVNVREEVQNGVVQRHTFWEFARDLLSRRRRT